MNSRLSFRRSVSLCGHSFRMALYKCCSFSDDSMEEETEVFILNDNSKAGRDLQQSCFRSASLSTLSAIIDPSSSLCQRNTSVPCDLSSLSTYSDVCLGGLQQSAPCNCSSIITCKVEQTPIVMELMLSEACTLVSPAPPPKVESPPIKFSPSMTSTLSSAVLSQVLPFPSTLSAAAPEFLPRYPAQSNKIASLRSGEPGKNMLYLPTAFNFPEPGHFSSHPWTIPYPTITSSYDDNVRDTTGDCFVTMSELLQVGFLSFLFCINILCRTGCDLVTFARYILSFCPIVSCS